MTGKFQDTQAIGEFPKYPDIWIISQMPRFLGNFSNIQSFEKFPKLKNIPPSNTYRNFGNFPNAWVSGKFPICLFKNKCKCCRVMQYYWRFIFMFYFE